MKYPIEQNLPVTHWMRTTTLFMRVTSSIAIVAFLHAILFPTLAAAKVAIEQDAKRHEIILHGTPEQKMNQALLKAQELAARKQATLTERVKNESGALDTVLDFFGLSQLRTEDVDDLQALATVLEAQHADALSGFSETEADLRTKGLPEEILQRHRDVVAKYQATYADMRARLNVVLEAKSLKDQQVAADALHGLMKEQKLKKRHQSTDPNKLPWGTPDASKTRKPVETAEQLSDVTGISRYPQTARLAANVITPDMLGQPGGPVAEDLSETPDIQFSEAIRAKALALNDDPVQIYNWVRNNIEFIPSYGSIQGADYTLQAMKGNAFDTASLLIALLRAANIPARYAYGTVQIPAEQVMNWVGGVDVPEAAQQLLGQGGIPNVGLVQGGKITHIKLEHIWVEAWADYFPSRGAKHKAGDSWLPLDASFKQYEFAEGIDFQTAIPFDAQGLVDQLQSNASVNESEGWVQGVSSADIESAMADYQAKIEQYVNNQNPGASVGDVLGTQKIILKELGQFAAGLPYKKVAGTSNFSVLPDSMRHKFRLTLQQASSSFYSGYYADVFTHTLSLPVIAGRLLSISYKPATPADEATLLSFIPQIIDGQVPTLADLPTTFPGYLINLSAELNIDGSPIVTYGSIPMGTEMNHRAELYTPSLGWDSTEATGIAGEHRAIGFDLQGIAPSQLDAVQSGLIQVQERIDSNDTVGLNKHSFTGKILQANIVSYFALNDTINKLQSASAGVIEYRLPSYGYFLTTLRPQYYFGIPRSTKFSGVTMDVPYLRSQSFSGDNNSESWVNYNRAKGVRASFMENWIPEQYFGTQDNPIEGVSAVKLIALAQEQGQKIFSFTSRNASYVSNINIDDDARRDIINALNAGKEVTVHQSPVNVNGWTGSGYLVLDPLTGAGGYLISGGANGGEVESEFVAKFLNFFNMYGISLSASEALGLILFGSIPKSWIGASPLLGSTNPLTSVLRALNAPFAKFALMRALIIPAISLIGVFIGFYNVTIMIQALIYAAI